MDYFSERLLEAQRRKRSVAMLGVDPQLDARGTPGLPDGYTLSRFCCAIVEACAGSVCAIKPQLAFFEARGMDGMRALGRGDRTRAPAGTADGRRRQARRYRIDLGRVCRGLPR